MKQTGCGCLLCSEVRVRQKALADAYLAERRAREQAAQGTAEVVSLTALLAVDSAAGFEGVIERLVASRQGLAGNRQSKEDAWQRIRLAKVQLVRARELSLEWHGMKGAKCHG